jgi:hypothetical protein
LGVFGGFCPNWIFVKKGNCWTFYAQRWQKKGWRLETGGSKDLPQRAQRTRRNKVGGERGIAGKNGMLYEPAIAEEHKMGEILTPSLISYHILILKFN